MKNSVFLLVRVTLWFKQGQSTPGIDHLNSSVTKENQPLISKVSSAQESLRILLTSMVIFYLRSKCVPMKNEIFQWGQIVPCFSPWLSELCFRQRIFFKGILKCSLMSKNQSINTGRNSLISMWKKVKSWFSISFLASFSKEQRFCQLNLLSTFLNTSCT